jgi:uncharacterized protein YbaR (Trm112 family)
MLNTKMLEILCCPACPEQMLDATIREEKDGDVDGHFPGIVEADLHCPQCDC